MAKGKRVKPSPGEVAAATADSAERSRSRGSSKSRGISRNTVLVEWHGAYALIPVALALLTALNTLNNGFAVDDLSQVVNNPFIKDISSLPQAFTTSVWAFKADDIRVAATDSYYRPLFTIFLTLNYALFGATAWGWHLANVLVHAGVTGLAYVTVQEVTGRDRLALLTAMFFAVHPAHAESVAWVSGVTDPLMGLLALASFYAYLRYRRKRRAYLLAVALVFYLLALLSKETALVLPLVIAYCELMHFRDAGPCRGRVARAAALMGLYAAPAVIYFLLRYNALQDLLTSSQARFALRYVLATLPAAAVKYLGLLSWPAGYSFIRYSPPAETFFGPAFLGSLALLIAILTAVVWSRSRPLMFAGVWFVVWLLPPLFALRTLPSLYAIQDRYLYLPSLGFCLAAALGIEWVASRRVFGISGKWPAAVAALGLLALWGVVHFRQNRVWRDTLTVIRHSVMTDPRQPLARTTLASHYLGAGSRREAEDQIDTALRLDPHCLDAHILLSTLAANDGKVDKAVEHIQEAMSAVREGPHQRGYLARLHFELGRHYAELKDDARAEEHLRQSVDILPYVTSRDALGDFYFDRGRYEEAREMYELNERELPKRFAPVQLKLARAYDRLRRVEQARAAYQKYLQLSPPTDKERDAVRRRLSQL